MGPAVAPYDEKKIHFTEGNLKLVKVTQKIMRILRAEEFTSAS